MGSDGAFIELEEAAAILAVTPQMVHKYVEKGMLPCHYPTGKKPGVRRSRTFRRVDVDALAELREDGICTSQAALISHVLGLSVKIRRLEQGHDELLCYLGMSDHKLSTDYADVMQLYLEAKQIIEQPLSVDDLRDVRWARRLLPIGEDYLAIVKMHTQDKEPWQVFTNSLKRLLVVHSDPGPIRAVLENALLNLRNASFLYICSLEGPRIAKKKFTHASYTGRVFGLLFPEDEPY